MGKNGIQVKMSQTNLMKFFYHKNCGVLQEFLAPREEVPAHMQNYNNYVLLKRTLIKQTKCTKMTVDCERMAKTRFPKSKVQSSIFDFDSETSTISIDLFIYLLLYLYAPPS